MGRIINKAAGYKELKIGVLGAGGVGKCFLHQLDALITRYAATAGSPKLSLVLVARSSKVLYSPDYTALDASAWESQLAAAETKLSLAEIIDFMANSPADSVPLLVDNTSSQDIAEQYPTMLASGVSIVTPNKKAFSGDAALFDALQPAAAKSGAVFFHESSVGASLPVLTTLKDLVTTGDTPTKIEGVFSGTLSYLFGLFAPTDGAENGSWSSMVAKAKAMGYTEPDPRDDLNGLDVARKVTILARLCGVKVPSPTAFPLQSLIPAELEGVASADEFMQRLPEFDQQMEQVKQDAAKQGKVVRFVGSIDVPKGAIKVGMELFDKHDPIATLKPSDNIISFHTPRYLNPLIIMGGGAGGEITAMGVMADLLRVVDKFL